ncbi:nuclear transport factor 2 family protein [Methylobacterium sp. J-030]|uniref:nuclear transport factor 2 family protein n=1 Tax=Methylobacterium sp. J-030 TaxID=2836627 RepID=UPI001FB933D9|nr:nuclear transport factor 2 family protein [Methylobacterium sp. J-030]MCJ2068883.1 nuclear transport factor 2 family protein [Methylobacterium sp. J-030]
MTEATTEAGRRTLLEHLFAAFNRHDVDGVMACFTPGVVFDTASGPEAHGRRLTGQDAVRAAFVGVWTEMPDVAWAVADHTIAGDRATSEWLFTGTRPDGRRIEVDGVDLFTFEGDLIARKSAFRKDRPVPAA